MGVNHCILHQAQPYRLPLANSIRLQAKRSGKPLRADNQTAPSCSHLSHIEKENTINKTRQTVVSQNTNQIAPGLSIQEPLLETKSLAINSQEPIVKNESEEIQAPGQGNGNRQRINLATLVSQLKQRQRQLQLLLLENMSNLLIRSMTQHQERYLEEGSEMPLNNLTIRRIQNQLKDIRKNPPINWRVIQNPEKWNEWIVKVNAHDDSPFHSIPIDLIVRFRNDYPHSKPFIRLQSPHLFYHPNIWPSGVICQDKMNQAKPLTTIRQRIEGFVFVLSHPNPKHPANNAAAAQYENNYRQYRKKAFKIFRQIKDKS